MKTEEILALKGIKGVGSKAIAKLIKYLENIEVNSLLDINVSEIIKHPDFSRYRKVLGDALEKNSLLIKIAESSNKLSEYSKQGIHVISITDCLYPAPLRLIESPPELLFCRGNIELLTTSKNVAVVGTRNNTPLGEVIARKTTQFIVSEGYNIVSGLALGIDTIAHDECLKCNGKTIAVLVDVVNVQPSTNRSLADRILANDGLLISENEPNIKIVPPLFVKRDRIQTGISLAVFPIETSVDGGTMHAVNAAKDNDRLIYVPDPNYSGYKDKSILQLSGIIALAGSENVIPYTKQRYPTILECLVKKECELSASDDEQGSLF